MIYLQNTKLFYINGRQTLSKWIAITSVRASCSTVPQKKTYHHTILIPKSNFPAKTDNANKLEIEKVAQFSDLYNWQRENLKGESYILHDGPPYATGDLHIGHAVNKIIKDIVNRSQVLQGRKVHYIPGWDCHGLPIELKALQQAREQSGKTNEPTDPVEIRQVARKFALETVEKQKQTFKELGIMADWNNSYLTMNKEYVKNQLKLFYKMYQKGFITRSLKPVYWSASSRTALAEAELVNIKNYKGTQAYVKFPLNEIPPFLSDVAGSKKVHALIWTTMPWTLIANRAICYNPAIEYRLVSIDNELYIVASELIQALEETLDKSISNLVQFSGSKLHGITYSSAFSNSRPLLAANHITTRAGSGLVHMAPAHTPHDFEVALEHGIDVECNVDESGCYTNVHPSLDGLPVLTTGQEAIMDLLKDSIIHKAPFTPYSFPLDWRTKQPVILRASQQWFINTAEIKKKALEALTAIEIMPSITADKSRHSFGLQLEIRPYWCISRQRAWGVPIPVVYDGDKPVLDERIIDRLCSLIDEQDTDVWWTKDVQDFIPDDVKIDHKLDGKEITKGKDTMDIWLDSGLSWHTLPDQAHVYSEGVDQLTGWFQASLLTSLALNDRAPYKSMFVHGFVVDKTKQKMSKSEGNVTEPNTIIYGGDNLIENPAYGIDTLRWWVASHATQQSKIILSKKLMDDCRAEVARIRILLKFIIGAISDVPQESFNKSVPLNYFDKYILNESQEITQSAVNDFNSFKYNSVCLSLLHLLSNKVSALYCNCVKYKLYCFEKGSIDRLTSQLVLHSVLMSICKVLAPILPHLVEELWLHHPLYKNPFYFTHNIPVLTVDGVNDDLMNLILDIKKNVIALINKGNLKQFEATVKVKSDLYEQLSKLNVKSECDSVLCEILDLSSVKLEVFESSEKIWDVHVSMTKNSQCPRCLKYNLTDDRELCERCDKVVNLTD